MRRRREGNRRRATPRPVSARSAAARAAPPPQPDQACREDEPGQRLTGRCRCSRPQTAGTVRGGARVPVGRHHGLSSRSVGLGRDLDLERDRGHRTTHAGRVRRAHRLRRTVVARNIAAVRPGGCAAAAAGHVVTITTTARDGTTLAGGRGAGAVATAVRCGRGAAAFGEGWATLLGAEAATGVVARGVAARASLRGGRRAPAQHERDGGRSQ